MSDKDFNNSYKYFENRDCKYYPCHNLEHINCMFCYCPLYSLKNCPGKFELKEKDGRVVKSCLNCDFPHKLENYDKIMGILKNHK